MIYGLVTLRFRAIFVLSKNMEFLRSFFVPKSSKVKRAGNPNWRPGGPSPNPGGRPPKDKTVIELARKYKPDCIRELHKMATGTAVPWKIKLEAILALLAYGGHPLPRPSQAAQMSRPGGEPLKASPSVFIYNSKEEAQAAADASATTDDELSTMVFLPSNGYEVRLKPDGTPEEADKTLPLAPETPMAGKLAPPQGSRDGRLQADEEDDSLA
jgi:hypothetical protein